MPHKTIIDVGKDCARLAAAAFEHRTLIVDGLENKFQTELAEGERFDQIGRLLSLLGSDLETRHHLLVASEDELRKKQRKGRHGRDLRDDSHGNCREHLFKIRRLWDAAVGLGSAADLFEEETDDIPTDPVATATVSRRTVNNLLDFEGFVLPDLQLPVEINRVDLAASLEKDLVVLEGVLSGVQRGVQSTNTAYAFKDRHLEGERREAIAAAKLLEAITVYAGWPDVARRIRISNHPSRRNARVVDAPGDTTTPSSEGSSPAPANDEGRASSAGGGAVESAGEVPAGEVPGTSAGSTSSGSSAEVAGTSAAGSAEVAGTSAGSTSAAAGGSAEVAGTSGEVSGEVPGTTREVPGKATRATGTKPNGKQLTPSAEVAGTTVGATSAEVAGTSKGVPGTAAATAAATPAEVAGTSGEVPGTASAKPRLETDTKPPRGSRRRRKGRKKRRRARAQGPRRR